jgi:methionyl-tRNA formyltransferase
MQEGAYLIVKSLELVEQGDYKTMPQNLKKGLHNAPKIFKETCEIDWKQNSEQILNLIRGLSPYPAARTEWKGQVFKIFEAEIASTSNPNSINLHDIPPFFTTDGKSYLQVKTMDSCINLLDVQLEGKKRMKVAEFLKGVR